MKDHGISWVLWLSVAALGCGDDLPGGGDTDATGSETGATSMMTTAAMTTAAMTTMGMTADGTTGEPPGDTTDGGTTEPPAETTGTAGETTGEPATDGTDTTAGTDTGAEDAAYPPCDADAKPQCPEPYEGCYEFVGPEFSVCTLACEDPDACPQPATGDAQPACGGPQMDMCVLDCSNEELCPDDMQCVPVGGGGGIARCAWPVK